MLDTRMDGGRVRANASPAGFVPLGDGVATSSQLHPGGSRFTGFERGARQPPKHEQPALTMSNYGSQCFSDTKVSLRPTSHLETVISGASSGLRRNDKKLEIHRRRNNPADGAQAQWNALLDLNFQI